MLSLVAVRPEDALEAGRPGRGVNLRIRVAHRNSNHGLLKEPLAQFEKLIVNGKRVSPELVSVPSKRNPDSFEDQYRVYPLSVSAGRIQARAVVRVLKDDSLVERTIEFVV